MCVCVSETHRDGQTGREWRRHLLGVGKCKGRILIVLRQIARQEGGAVKCSEATKTIILGDHFVLNKLTERRKM